MLILRSTIEPVAAGIFLVHEVFRASTIGPSDSNEK
jgi:hypothetical protein